MPLPTVLHGGTLGTGTGAVVGLLFAAFVLLAYLSVFKRQMKRERRAKVDSYSYIFKILFITIIPVLMSTTIYNCNAILDQAIFKNIANLQGYSANDISEWNGIYTGKYKTLINVPISIASALAASSVPALTAAYTNGKKEAVRSQINTANPFYHGGCVPLCSGNGCSCIFRFYSFCSVISSELGSGYVACLVVCFYLYFSRMSIALEMVCYRD